MFPLSLCFFRFTVNQSGLNLTAFCVLITRARGEIEFECAVCSELEGTRCAELEGSSCAELDGSLCVEV